MISTARELMEAINDGRASDCESAREDVDHLLRLEHNEALRAIADAIITASEDDDDEDVFNLQWYKKEYDNLFKCNRQHLDVIETLKADLREMKANEDN